MTFVIFLGQLSGQFIASDPPALTPCTILIVDNDANLLIILTHRSNYCYFLLLYTSLLVMPVCTVPGWMYHHYAYFDHSARHVFYIYPFSTKCNPEKIRKLKLSLVAILLYINIFKMIKIAIQRRTIEIVMFSCDNRMITRRPTFSIQCCLIWMQRKCS